MTSTIFLGEPPTEVSAWLERRRVLGQDGHDEVWDGVYHVVPMANSRHGDVEMQVGDFLNPQARRVGLRPVGAVNIGLSKHDFRVPDLTFIRGRDHAVYLPTAAIVGEVVSPNDESYAKFGFYFVRGVDELLIVDPIRRAVEWYVRGIEGFVRSGRSVLLGIDEAALHAEIDWPA